MPYKYVQPRFATKNNYSEWPSKRTLFNGGIDLVTPEHKLPDNKTSKSLNVWYIDGELDKRWGQEYFLDGETVESPCYSAYLYEFSGYFIKHCGTKMYKQDVLTGISTEILPSLNATQGVFFRFNGKLYYIQSGKYVVWDGATASLVVGYIPTVIINRLPTGGGDTNEGYNRIQPGFKNSFNGNGSAVAYTLTDANLDATAVTATVGGVAKVEGVDFTVARVTGIVTFGVAPASGTNNVIITAYKTIAADIASILNCTAAIPYGGQNDNRVFFGANGTGYYFWSGISSVGVDATYFPFNNYNIVGNADEPIFGFGKHYSILVVLKKRELMAVNYFFDGTTGVFNSWYINSQYGCDCPKSIQTINNNLVWLNSVEGVIILLGTNVDTQRNAFTCSRNIDPSLLAETNLTTASSVDFDGKYWLIVNDKAYVWDYYISPYVDTGNPDNSASNLSWWYFDTIDASVFIKRENTLYYGGRTDGRTVRFHMVYDSSQFNDFGNAINGLYRYPRRQLGDGMYEFSVLRGFVDVKGDRVTNHLVTYFTSDQIYGETKTELITVGSFAWFPFSWASFTWGVMGPLFNWVLTPFLKNIRWFAVEFSNNEVGKSLNISSFSFQYQITRQIR